eukprot:TRINITY_DN7978_c0_g1_i1.p1 TRINITY_DN7978_c0_g1~~TRINITY_DN7978_c0_g1_i1.p1  ORF type:complete len:423 (-),score=54.34 TRINITY_DN7978_c0_g1_i1:112-1380(-)
MSSNIGVSSTRLSWCQTAVLTLIITFVIVLLQFKEINLDEQQQQFEYSNQGRHLQGAGAKKIHVLVTGGAGYIGSHAALKLLEEGHAVTVVDNLSRGNRGALSVLERISQNYNVKDKNKVKKRFHFFEGDLGNLETVQNLFRTSNIDVVMHFAAVAYVAESVAEPLRYYQNVTANTVNILKAMKENGVKKLVYSSTCAVYGNPPSLPVTEETPPNPINPYGRSKFMTEQLITDFAKTNRDFESIIFRYFNVYGSDPQGRLGEYPRPDLRHYGRISGACLDAALGEIEALTITGTTHPTEDGSAIRDYIHVTDLVNAHIMGMSFMSNPPALFNIGTGKGVSVKQFVNGCKAATGMSIKVIEQKEARKGDYAALYSNVSKIESQMGWKAQYTDVVQSLAHAWKWRKQNPKGYAPAMLHLRQQQQ